MGFSGGGSNILLPHTHDGTVAQDGGALNFNNVTQSSSSAGEVFYSDGVHLQQLAYPGVPAGETLTATALSTAPSWAAGGSGGATLTRHSVTVSTSTSTSSTSYVDVPSMTATMSGTGAGNCIANYTTTVQSSNDFAFTCEWSTDGDIPTSPIFDGTGGAGKVVNIFSCSATLGSQVGKFMQKLDSAGTLIVCRNNTDAYAQWLEIS